MTRRRRRQELQCSVGNDTVHRGEGKREGEAAKGSATQEDRKTDGETIFLLLFRLAVDVVVVVVVVVGILFPCHCLCHCCCRCLVHTAPTTEKG